MSFIQDLKQVCRGTLKTDEPLSEHTSLKVGGRAECWIEPMDLQDLKAALQIASKSKKRLRVIGAGSNLLVGEQGLEGLVIHLTAPVFKNLECKNDVVSAGSAVMLTSFISYLIKQGFGECEFLYGIPAQVGGAVFMNAGGPGKWVSKYVQAVHGIRFNGELCSFTREQAAFEYRSSGLKEFIITKVDFCFPRVAPEVTRQNVKEYADYRKRTQDLRYPSAGCMFRNPEGEKSAGRLIEEAGLKGRREGQAMISDVHANFMVNLGGAKAQDFLKLLKTAEEEVAALSHVRLRREIQILNQG